MVLVEEEEFKVKNEEAPCSRRTPGHCWAVDDEAMKSSPWVASKNL